MVKKFTRSEIRLLYNKVVLILTAEEVLTFNIVYALNKIKKECKMHIDEMFKKFNTADSEVSKEAQSQYLKEVINIKMRYINKEEIPSSGKAYLLDLLCDFIKE